ncbi:MAG: radical SAM family heme chaperone HemW [Ignavibacteria bacterium]
MNLKESGLYIHIPFCRKKCDYCDFYLITNTNILGRFLKNLKAEIILQSEKFRDYKFDTIFIGGGTPSLFTEKQIESIVNTLNKYYKIDSESEITIEANPEDFSNSEKFTSLKNAGINRISFGVQSFIDEELKLLTREHTAKQAIEVIEKAKNTFDNISIDLIYSLPNQDKSNLEKTLIKTLELEIPHISAYTLIFEKETPIYNMMDKKQIKKNDDELESQLYLMFSDKLVKAGYEHYEVSNYAKKGYESKHNLKYWEYNNYLGFGPSAHSFFNGKRWSNFRNIIKYNINLQKNELAIENEHTLTEEESKMEFIMLGLRSKGVNLKKYYELFRKIFTDEYIDSLNILSNEKLGIQKSDSYCLTEKGYLMVDEICAKYF